MAKAQFSSRLLEQIRTKNWREAKLDLSGQLLDENDAKQLAEALACNPYITTVDISNNNIGNEGAGALLKCKCKNLTSLNISKNGIGPAPADAGDKAPAINETFKFFLRSLANNDTLISLTASQNNFGDEGAAMVARNKALTWVDLSETNIGPSGAQTLANNKTLTHLNLSKNKIGDLGVKAFVINITLDSLNISWNTASAEAIKDLLTINEVLHSVDISGNKFNADVAQAIAQHKKLQRVSLAYCEAKPEDIIAIVQNPRLRYLNISGYQPEQSVAANTAIKRHLDGIRAIARHQELEELVMSDCGLNVSVADIFTADGALPALLALDLSFNYLHDGGAIKIAPMPLTRLNLRSNFLGPASAQAIARNQSLREINLNGNKLGDEGVKVLAENSKATKLGVNKNNVSDTGLALLLQSPILTDLDISYNPISATGRELLLDNKRLLQVKANLSEVWQGEVFESKLETRLQENRRSWENYLRVVALITSLRANTNHSMRLSILPLLQGIADLAETNYLQPHQRLINFNKFINTHYLKTLLMNNVVSSTASTETGVTVAPVPETAINSSVEQKIDPTFSPPSASLITSGSVEPSNLQTNLQPSSTEATSNIIIAPITQASFPQPMLENNEVTQLIELTNLVKAQIHHHHRGEQKAVQEQFKIIMEKYASNDLTEAQAALLVEVCLVYTEVCLQKFLITSLPDEQKKMDLCERLRSVAQNAIDNKPTSFAELQILTTELIKRCAANVRTRLTLAMGINQITFERIQGHLIKADGLCDQLLKEHNGLFKPKTPAAPIDSFSLAESLISLQHTGKRIKVSQDEIIRLVKSGLAGNFIGAEIENMCQAAAAGEGEEKKQDDGESLIDLAGIDQSPFKMAIHLIKHHLPKVDQRIAHKLGFDLIWLKLIQSAPAVNNEVYLVNEDMAGDGLGAKLKLETATVHFYKERGTEALKLIEEIGDGTVVQVPAGWCLHAYTMYWYLRTSRFLKRRADIDATFRWFAQSEAIKRDLILSLHVDYQQASDVNSRAGAVTIPAEKEKLSKEAQDKFNALLAKLSALNLDLPFMEAECVHQLGSVSLQLNQLEQALDCYTKSLELHKRLGDKSGIADAHYCIATIHHHQQQKNYQLAAEHYRKCFQINKDLDNPSGQADTLLRLGQVLYRLVIATPDKRDLWQECYQAFYSAIDFAMQDGDRETQSMAMKGLGDLWWVKYNNQKAKGELAELSLQNAISCWENAVSITLALNYRAVLHKIANTLTQAYHAAGNEYYCQWWRMRLANSADAEHKKTCENIPIKEILQARYSKITQGDFLFLLVLNSLSSEKLFPLFNAFIAATEVADAMVGDRLIKRLVNAVKSRIHLESVEKLVEDELASFIESYRKAVTEAAKTAPAEKCDESLHPTMLVFNWAQTLKHWAHTSQATQENTHAISENKEDGLIKQLPSHWKKHGINSWQCECCKIPLTNVEGVKHTSADIEKLLSHVHRSECLYFQPISDQEKALVLYFNVCKQHLFSLSPADSFIKQAQEHYWTSLTWLRIAYNLVDFGTTGTRNSIIIKFYECFQTLFYGAKQILAEADNFFCHNFLCESPLRSLLNHGALLRGAALFRDITFIPEELNLIPLSIEQTHLPIKLSTLISKLATLIPAIYQTCHDELNKWRENMLRGAEFPYDQKVLYSYEKRGLIYKPTLLYPAQLQCKCCDWILRNPEPWMDAERVHLCSKINFPRPALQFIQAESPPELKEEKIPQLPVSESVRSEMTSISVSTLQQTAVPITAFFTAPRNDDQQSGESSSAICVERCSYFIQ